MSSPEVLLVDDSLSARFTLTRSLEQHALKVHAAKSAEEGLQMLSQLRPAGIFMDHVLPGMDGLQAVEQIRQMDGFADIPIIMCSSNDDDAYRHEATARGANAVLHKPPDPEALRQLVQQHLYAPTPVPEPAMLSPETRTEDATPDATLAALDARIERVEQLLERLESSINNLDTKTAAIARSVADQSGRELANRLLRAVITLKGR